MSRNDKRPKSNGRRTPPTDNPSWNNLFTSTVLRIVISSVLLILVAEKTFMWYFADKKTVNVDTLIISGWVIAALNMTASIFALVGVLQNRFL